MKCSSLFFGLGGVEYFIFFIIKIIVIVFYYYYHYYYHHYSAVDFSKAGRVEEPLKEVNKLRQKKIGSNLKSSGTGVGRSVNLSAL